VNDIIVITLEYQLMWHYCSAWTFMHED